MAHTPEIAAALQLLYATADRASTDGQAILFRVMASLTGKPVAFHSRQWQATR